MQVGIAENIWVPLANTEADVGLTATEERVCPEDFVMVIAMGPACLVIPFKEAFTKRLRLPELLPAVNITGFPAEEFKLPRAWVKVHE